MLRTPPGLDDFIYLLSGLHSPEVEQLDDWSRLLEFWGIVGWRRELFDDSSSNTGGRLFPPHDRTVAEIALDEQDHFLIAHQDFVATDAVQPALQRRSHPHFIFIRTSSSCGQRRRHGGYEGFGIVGDEMVGQLDKLRVCSTDVPELRGPKARKIGLSESVKI